MKILKTKFEGLHLIELKPNVDNRGSFTEIYRNNLFNEFHIKFDLCQHNRVHSKKNVLRGLHFQKAPFSQTKIISVSNGKILDVVLDLRVNSKTYAKYFSIILDSKVNRTLYVPRGFAHGYLSLEDNTIVDYMVDNYYNEDSEDYIYFLDPHLNINWGMDKEKITISEKDSKYKIFKW